MLLALHTWFSFFHRFRSGVSWTCHSSLLNLLTPSTGRIRATAQIQNVYKKRSHMKCLNIYTGLASQINCLVLWYLPCCRNHLMYFGNMKTDIMNKVFILSHKSIFTAINSQLKMHKRRKDCNKNPLHCAYCTFINLLF